MKLKRGVTLFVATLMLALLGMIGQPANQLTAEAAKYSLKTFPKRIRGTWYTYDKYEHKTRTIKITAKTLKDGKYVSRLHARKVNANIPDHPKVVHSSWITADNYPVFGEHWVDVRGWYQTSGDGGYYRKVTHKIHGKKHTMLQMAGGAGVWTNSYGYHSKKLAKANANRWFKGDRHNLNH